jgi:hypothetical protein
MSTKSSLAYLTIPAEPEKIHIYKEMLDNKYYLETNKGKLEIAKTVAEAFSFALKTLEKK